MADTDNDDEKVEPVKVDMTFVADRPVKLSISINRNVVDAEILADDDLPNGDTA